MNTKFCQRRVSCLGHSPGRILAFALITLALSASAAPSAFAAEPITFAQTGEGAGQIQRSQGMAVDQSTGNLYIADQNNRRVDEFDAGGAFLRAFGFGVRTGAEVLETCTAASDCVKGIQRPNLVTAGAVNNVTGIAASGGHVWVADDFQRLTEFAVGGADVEVLRVVGGDVTAFGPDDSGVSAVQKVTVTAEGGTFKLKLRNPFTEVNTAAEIGETVALPYNASAAEVEGALNALSTIGGLGGSVTVTGGPGDPAGSSPYQIAFGGHLAGDSISNFTTVNNLTGAIHTISVSTSTPGGSAEMCVPANGDVCKIGSSGTANGQLGQRRSPLAIDGSGNLWVGDLNRVQELSPSGAYLASVPLPGRGNTSSLAVNTAGTKIYVISAAAAYATSVHVYETATGTELSAPIDDLPGQYKTLALDSGEHLFVADRQATEEPAVFREFNSAGEQIGQFGAGQVFGTEGPAGIAVGSAALYSNSAAGSEFAAQRFPLPAPGPLIYDEVATDILPTTATLKARLDPEGKETTYHFEYGTDAGYGQSTLIGTLAAGFYDETIEASLSGLTPSTTYHFRLIAEDSEGRITNGPDRTFTTLPAVQIENESAIDVSATAATLQANLDPLGVAAEWWVEYGSSEGYGILTARGSLAAGFGSVPVSVHVGDLVPGTIYHYRFVAEGEREGVMYTVHGVDRTFTTQPGASPAGMLDGRAWEMVTPPAKPGPIRPLELEGLVEAAAGGGAFAYLTTALGEEAQGAQPTNQVLAVRDPGLGWRSHDLALPQDRVAGLRLGNTDPYRQFSPDLASSVVQQAPEDKTLLSPDASEKTPYLRHQALCEAAAPGCYTPLITGEENHANVPPGTEFGDAVEFAGATPDLDYVALRSNVALTADPAPAGGLYEWSAVTQGLRLISVLPGGGVAPGADLGTETHVNVRHAISPDGSRVVFASQGHLYLRDTAQEETVQLDSIQGGIGSGSPGAVFQTASVDDSRVLFTSAQKLTPGSGAVEGKPDLYVCDLSIDEITGHLGCSLTDLTPRTGAGESASVRGMAPGAAEDGSLVYFVANGALAPGAVSGTCGPGNGSSGELCNLYALRFIAGEWQTPRLVAVLSTEDQSDWAGPGQPRYLTSRVSPNGRWLAFMSSRPLTGYENRDAASSERDEEVFLYDADSAHLLCASCNPSGARPQGAQIVGEEPEAIVDAQGIWQHRWLAASVPGWTNASGNNFLHQPRYLSDSGRIFFNSPDALAPSDGNGNWDVYEFEPAGIGDCTGSNPRYEPDNDGCLALVSSSHSTRVSTFMDASESGDDVFFLTSAKLAPEDSDTAADVYDAHVCSSESPCLPSPPPSARCADSTTCQGPPTATPTAENPPTATLNGRGNVHPHNRCGAVVRRARAFSRRARALRREARALNGASPRRARRLRAEAASVADHAHDDYQRARRCRRANGRGER